MNRYLLALCTITVLIINGCSSGKQALERGDYDASVTKSVSRLRGNPKHKKSRQTLEMAYPLAKKWHLDRINTAKASQDPYKWERITEDYRMLNKHYEDINRCPVCLRLVPDATRYTQQYDQARKNAADVRYNMGVQELEKGIQGDRMAAKEAYNHFMLSNQLYEDYKDVQQKLVEAKFHATLKVLVEPVPMHSRNLQLSNEFFDNKITEFLHNMPASEFVQFFTPGEASSLGLTQPNQIIQLQFDDFVIGKVTLKEQEKQLLKDSVIIAWVDDPNYTPPANAASKENPDPDGDGKVTVCHIPADNPANAQTLSIDVAALETHLKHGDYIGPCTTEGGSEPESRPGKMPVYGKAKATVHIFTKTLESSGVLDMKIIDGFTGKVLSQEKLPGTYIWSSEWGYYNGDEKALEEEHKRIIGSKEAQPPSTQDLFIAFTQPIYDQITVKIRSFYANY